MIELTEIHAIDQCTDLEIRQRMLSRVTVTVHLTVISSEKSEVCGALTEGGHLREEAER